MLKQEVQNDSKYSEEYSFNSFPNNHQFNKEDIPDLHILKIYALNKYVIVSVFETDSFAQYIFSFPIIYHSIMQLCKNYQIVSHHFLLLLVHNKQHLNL